MDSLRRLLPLLLLLPGLAAAAPTPLRFVSIETAPWASQGQGGGPPTGFFPDLVREMARRIDRPIAISLQPFVRIGQELESGAQDCTIVALMPEWQRFVRAGAVVYRHEIGVIARRGVALRTPADLKGKTFSVLRGLAMGAAFDADPSVAKESDTDYRTGLRKLAHQRVDGIAGALQTIEYLADQAGLGEHLGDRLSLGELPLALQCSAKSVTPERMRQLDASLGAALRDGTVQRLLLKNNYR